jgi:hypothetical protein
MRRTSQHGDGRRYSVFPTQKKTFTMRGKTRPLCSSALDSMHPHFSGSMLHLAGSHCRWPTTEVTRPRHSITFCRPPKHNQEILDSSNYRTEAVEGSSKEPTQEMSLPHRLIQYSRISIVRHQVFRQFGYLQHSGSSRRHQAVRWPVDCGGSTRALCSQPARCHSILSDPSRSVCYTTWC